MKKVIGYENYAVDQSGNVYSLKTKKPLKQQTSSWGYKTVGLYKNGCRRVKRVHRLVAEAFIPNPDKLPYVNHKDENKENNKVENLEWCNAKYNNFYGRGMPTAKAVKARRKSVCQYTKDGELIAMFESTREAQRRTGIQQGNISKCCLNRKHFKTAGGYVWKFE